MSRRASKSAVSSSAVDALPETPRIDGANGALRRARVVADAAIVWIDRRVGAVRTLFAALGVAIGSYLLCLLLYAPPLWIGPTSHYRTQDFVRQAVDPLTRDLSEPILAYRPVHPLILHVLGLRSAESVRVFLAAYVIAFLFLLFVFLRSRTSAAVAVLACFALSTTMVIQVGTYLLDFPGSLCWSIALGMMVLRPGWAVLLVPLGMLTDERFILTAGLIPLLKLRLAGSRFDLRQLVRYGAPILAGVGVTFVIRYALQVGWIGPGINTLPVYKRLIGDLARIVPTDVARRPYLVPLAIFFVLRFAWLLPLAAIRTCQNRDDRIVQYLAGLLALFGAYAVFIGADWTRSLTYLFPIWLLALFQLEARDRAYTARILLTIIALNVVTPQLSIDPTDSGFGLVRPLPFAVARYLTGWDVADLFR